MEIWPQMPVGVLNRSLGRALEWHSRGQRFDPAYLHQGKVLKLQGFRDFFFFRCGQQNRPISNSYLTVSGILSGGEQTSHFIRYGLLAGYIQMAVDIGGHFYV